MAKTSLIVAALLATASTASAQLISIRTVPVSQSHQFDIFPSRTVGMGGVSIAVRDSLLDPFVNPALAVRAGSTRFFGTPSTYSVSHHAGAGRTLPIGALGRVNAWFGGVFVALQEVEMSDRPFLPPPCAVCLTSQGIQIPSPESSHGNTYAHALFGRDLGNGLSLGGSFDWSRLRAVDGVDLLYAGSAGLQQYGRAVDLRVGVLKELPGDRSLEALVLHNRFNTTHDVYYLDQTWDPGTGSFAQQPRLEKNLDRTSTWGVNVAYDQPIGTRGWRAGGELTINQMNHPKIPNYEIMNIPRDPGNSSAFNLGVGVARHIAKTTFGLDVVFEPIWSHTWADSESPVVAADGRVIAPGGMTIENRFRFSNVHGRIGVGQDFEMGNGPDGEVQLGLAVRRIQYHLDQTDHVQLAKRSLDEAWTEWQPTWGFTLRFPALDLRYHGSITNGTGRPGVANNGVIFAVDESTRFSGNILAAPSGPLTLDEVTVTTHQISISLPIH